MLNYIPSSVKIYIFVNNNYIITAKEAILLQKLVHKISQKSYISMRLENIIKIIFTLIFISIHLCKYTGCLVYQWCNRVSDDSTRKR